MIRVRGCDHVCICERVTRLHGAVDGESVTDVVHACRECGGVSLGEDLGDTCAGAPSSSDVLFLLAFVFQTFISFK